MMLPLKIDSLSVSDALSISLFGFVLVVIVLAFLALFVKLLSKIVSSFAKDGKTKKEKTKEPAQSTAPAVQTPVAPVTSVATPVAVADGSSELPYTPGYVTLDGVSEQDAAVVMAVTSDKTGIPLERLSFKSIKRLNQEPVLENIEEQDAAVVMAIVAERTGTPLENLCFNSIKSVEE